MAKAQGKVAETPATETSERERHFTKPERFTLRFHDSVSGSVQRTVTIPTILRKVASDYNLGLFAREGSSGTSYTLFTPEALAVYEASNAGVSIPKDMREALAPVISQARERGLSPEEIAQRISAFLLK